MALLGILSRVPSMLKLIGKVTPVALAAYGGYRLAEAPERPEGIPTQPPEQGMADILGQADELDRQRAGNIFQNLEAFNTKFFTALQGVLKEFGPKMSLQELKTFLDTSLKIYQMATTAHHLSALATQRQATGEWHKTRAEMLKNLLPEQSYINY